MHKSLSGLLVVVAALVAGHGIAGGGVQTRASEAVVFERKGDLYAVAIDGSRTVRLTRTRTFEVEPAISADGRSIAFKQPRPGARYQGSTRWPDFAQRGRIWAMDVEGERRARLTSGDDLGPSWSRDGQTIVFSHDVPGRFVDCPVVFRVRTSGRGFQRVTRLPYGAQYDAAVSPDGDRIAFTWSSGCEGGTVILALGVVDWSGRRTSDLARLPGNASFSPDDAEYWNPTWSPDGSRMAFEKGFVHSGDYGSGVFVASLDGSGLHQVTPPRMNAKDPAWSIDGTWIAFVRTGGNRDLYVIRPDGTGLRQLTRTKAGEYSPAWLPEMPAG